MVVSTEWSERLLPLIVHPVFQIIDALFFFGRLPNLTLDVTTRNCHKRPRLLVGTGRSRGRSLDRKFDQPLRNRIRCEHAHAAAVLQIIPEPSRPSDHVCLGVPFVHQRHEWMFGSQFG